MKILLASGSGIYDKRFPETSKNQSGFGIMIRALADMLTYENDSVDIITHSNLTRGRQIGKSILLPKTLLRLVIHMRPFYLRRALRLWKQKDISWGGRARILLGYMTGSYVEHLLKKTKYDVVHINGIGATSNAYMYACARTNTPFVLTLHGLISFGKEIKVSSFMRHLERNYFIYNKDNEKALATVISTGIKNRLSEVAGAPLDQVNVVCNPVIKTDEQLTVPYVKEENEKVVVCVGNISENKNQKLVVDAFAQMCRDNPTEKYKLFIIGGQEEGLKAHAAENGYENIVFTGALQRDMVYSYYSIADLCIMASLEEGFGLSLVEGYSFGVPCVMPSAIDAFPDLYDERCCVPAHDYEIATFVAAMHTALGTEWDHDVIKQYAIGFSQEMCAKKYLGVLRCAEKYKCTPMTSEDLDRIINESFD